MTPGMDAIVQLVLARLPDKPRPMLGIDGVDGSGKSTFAAGFARKVTRRPVVVVHLDDFLNPSKIRHRLGRHSPEGFWLHTYNEDALRADVFEPLGDGGDGRYRSAAYDSTLDRTIRPPRRQADDDALVIIEGMFLHRDGLSGVWDHSVFLDVPFEETARRMAARDGSRPDPGHESMRRYVDGQRIYFLQGRPWQRASLVIDNNDPTHPTMIAAEDASAARPIGP